MPTITITIQKISTTHITGINNTDLINADNNLDNFRKIFNIILLILIFFVFNSYK